MNDDFTKDEEQDVDFDPKKIKDSLLEDVDILDEDLAIDDVEDEEDYSFDGDTNSSDEDF